MGAVMSMASLAGTAGRPAMTGAAGNDNRIKGDALMAERANAEQWQRVKHRLKTELGEDVFNSWFARVELEDADNKAGVCLSVPTRFLKSWIQSHYQDRLLSLWGEERGTVARIELIVRGAVRARPTAPAEPRTETAAQPAGLPAAVSAAIAAPQARRAPEVMDGPLGGSPVEPRYTFDTFCEGVANRMAFAAARSVAESLAGKASQFNPLYIHAGV